MSRVNNIVVPLPAELYLELVDAAAETYQRDEERVTPEEFARECIVATLAERRLVRAC